MRTTLFLAAALALLGVSAAHADAITISDGNAQLVYTIDNAGANLGQPNDPVQLPRKVEWTVDGRRILVYPSGPSTFLDIGHLHPGAMSTPTRSMHRGRCSATARVPPPATCSAAWSTPSRAVWWGAR